MPSLRESWLGTSSATSGVTSMADLSTEQIQKLLHGKTECGNNFTVPSVQIMRHVSRTRRSHEHQAITDSIPGTGTSFQDVLGPPLETLEFRWSAESLDPLRPWGSIFR